MRDDLWLDVVRKHAKTGQSLGMSDTVRLLGIAEKATNRIAALEGELDMTCKNMEEMAEGHADKIACLEALGKAVQAEARKLGFCPLYHSDSPENSLAFLVRQLNMRESYLVETQRALRELQMRVDGTADRPSDPTDKGTK